MALTLATLISACSDASEPLNVASEDTSSNSSEVPRAQTVRYEITTTVVPEVQEREGAKPPAPLEEAAANEVIATSTTDAKPASDRGNESGDEDIEYATYVMLSPETGPVSLDERILRADIIARATLTSVSTSTPYLLDKDTGTTTEQYVSALELRFDAHEYLKGSRGDTLVVVLPMSSQDYYPSASEAVAAARDWLPERDTRWDGREAIIFLQNPISSQAESARSGSNIYVFSVHQWGEDLAHDIGTAYANHDRYTDTYSIRSEKNRVWLPATSASGSGASEPSFYLEEPSSGAVGASGAGVSGMSLSDLKSRVKEMGDLLKQGEGVDGYRKCLEEKYANERAIQTLGLEGIWTEASVSFPSGLPAGNVFSEGRFFGGNGVAGYKIPFFAGPDTHLFGIKVEDDDDDSRSYSAIARIKRPLPGGTYEVHYNVQQRFFIPCDYIQNSYLRWNVHVTAPAGTLHEAFFDPVVIGSAVGADSDNGVLKPASFIFEGVGDLSVNRIAWESGKVGMELAPHGRLTGHHIDFIALDGSVALRLDFDDSTATTTEGGGNALTWGVCEQPWRDRDLLMLRISESGTDLSGATNDLSCDAGPVATPSPSTSTSQFAERNLVAEPTHDSITLLWDALDTDAVTGYRILRRVQGLTEFREIAEVGRDSTVYVDTADIEPDTHYIYRIRAIVVEGAEAVADSRVTIRTPASQ